MCDYSLQNVKTRPAKVGDDLNSHIPPKGFFLEPISKLRMAVDHL
jgi:hypothetical protein